MTSHAKTVMGLPHSSTTSLEEAEQRPILLLDDDVEFVEELLAYLESHGEKAVAFTDPSVMLAYLAGNPARALIIDQNLGRVRGIEVLQRVQKRWAVPCIILSGMTDQVDRILGLEEGADDYIHKGVHPREVLARVRAVLRRAAKSPPVVADTATSRCDGWRLDAEMRELYAPDGAACRLTTAEFDILAALVHYQGQAVGRGRLCEIAFRRVWHGEDRAVDTVIVQLRRRLEPDPKHPVVIRSIRNFGYQFTGFPGT